MAGFIAAGASLIGSFLAADASSSAASAAQQSAQLQYQIADRIQQRAEYLFNRWKSDYEPMALGLKNEVAALPLYEPQYDTVAQRAVVQVRRQFTKARRDALACLDTHCVGAYCGLTKELAIAEASAAAWAAQAAVRTEDEKKFLRDQHRRSEIYRMSAFGMQAYSNPGGDAIAAQIYGQVGAAARQAASSNMAAAGYFLQRAFSNVGVQQQQPAAPIVQATPTYTTRTTSTTPSGWQGEGDTPAALVSNPTVDQSTGVQIAPMGTSPTLEVTDLAGSPVSDANTMDGLF